MRHVLLLLGIVLPGVAAPALADHQWPLCARDVCLGGGAPGRATVCVAFRLTGPGYFNSLCWWQSGKVSFCEWRDPPEGDSVALKCPVSFSED